MKVFGIFLFFIGLLALIIAPVTIDEYSMNSTVSQLQNDSFDLETFETFDEKKYKKVGQISGGICILVGLFCAFLGHEFEKNRTKPEDRSPSSSEKID